MPYLNYSSIPIKGIYYTQIEDLRIGLPLELVNEFDINFKGIKSSKHKEVALRLIKELPRDFKAKMVIEGLPKVEDDFYPDVEY
jgi:hypothetical protein